MDYIIAICPHCDFHFQVYLKDFNCRIFRCGVYIRDLQQISPHLDEMSCQKLAKNLYIYGCGKPFRINEKNICEPCDYI